MTEWLFLTLLALGFLFAIGLSLAFFVTRARKKKLFSAYGRGSFFEYSWAHVPIENELKTHLPVHYRLEGPKNKPLVILVHGLGANLNCWRRVFPLLKDHFQVLAFDLPGFGLTPDPEHFFAKQPEKVTQLLVDLLEKLKVKKPAHLIGNSLGGLLSLVLMEKFPSSFERAILINPALSRKLVRLPIYKFAYLAGPIANLLNRATLSWLYSRTLSKPRDLEPEVLDHLALNYLKNPDGIISFAHYVRIIEEQGIPEVDYSKCVFLFSGGDRVVTAPHQKRIHRFFPDAKIIFHPSGGHQLQEDEPQWLSEQVTEFFLSS